MCVTISCNDPKILLHGFLGEGMSGSIQRQATSLPLGMGEPTDPVGDLMYRKKAPAGLEAAAAEATAAWA